MKNIKGVFLIILMALFLGSCQEEVPEIGTPPTADQINLEVTQPLSIDEGGNTVVLRNLTKGVLPLWDYGTGRSLKQIDTIRFAFSGPYTIKRSAMAAGTLVQLPDMTINVTKENLSYVTDTLWLNISGGPNKEKTWVLDTDKNDVSKHFTGPLFFFGANKLFNPKCDGSEPNCWDWSPSRQSWMPGPADFGTMTFDLKGGPHVTVDQKFITASGVTTGGYYIDKDAKTVTFTNVIPLNIGWDQVWSKAHIVTLTKDFMQLAFKAPGKEEYEIYNYITKEYSDNWVRPPPKTPAIDDGFDPKFAAGELLQMLTGGAGSARQWKIDANGNPVDWVAKGHGFTTDKNSSWDWGWNSSWVTAVQDSWIRFDRFNGTQNYTRFQNGATTTGTFTINEATNEIVLNSNTLLLNPDSWMNPTTNTIKVVKAYPKDYQTKGIWFGTSYDAGKDEWLVFHYIIQ